MPSANLPIYDQSLGTESGYYTFTNDAVINGADVHRFSLIAERPPWCDFHQGLFQANTSNTNRPDLTLIASEVWL